MMKTYFNLKTTNLMLFPLLSHFCSIGWKWIWMEKGMAKFLGENCVLDVRFIPTFRADLKEDSSALFWPPRMHTSKVQSQFKHPGKWVSFLILYRYQQPKRPSPHSYGQWYLLGFHDTFGQITCWYLKEQKNENHKQLHGYSLPTRKRQQNFFVQW